jgi:hypothetical protein
VDVLEQLEVRVLVSYSCGFEKVFCECMLLRSWLEIDHTFRHASYCSNPFRVLFRCLAPDDFF